MNRRKLLLGSGVVLSTILAGCSNDDTSDGNGGADDTDNSGNSDGDGESMADFATTYNYKRYDRLITPDNEDVYYESDDETQYIGAQIRATNQTDEELSLGEFELSLLVEGSTDDVSIHAQSKTDPLEAIGAGETVETWLIFTVPPETESLDFGTTQWAEHSFDLAHDDDLEIALGEFKGE